MLRTPLGDADDDLEAAGQMTLVAESGAQGRLCGRHPVLQHG